MSIEAMKQALEALCELEQDMFHPAKVFKHKPTITALRTAIEQAEKQVEPFGHFQYDIKLDAWVKSKTNNGVAFYTTPPTGQPQDLNGGHQLDVAGHASTATITKWSYRDCGSEGWFIAETVAAPGGLLPQQEPVAWDDLLGAVARGWGHSKNAHKEMDSDLAIAIAEEMRALYVTPPAAQQSETPEPVAWMVYTLDGKSVCVTDNPQDFSDKNRVLPLYTDPPAAQRKWVGLTDDEIKDIVGRNDPGGIGRYTRDLIDKIEAKLKEKNT
jgi:hypothetical protein